MNTKLAVFLSILIAFTIVSAQEVPAVSSLTSKIESLSASYSRPQRSSVLSSASSAVSRISSMVSADRSSALSSATSALQSASSAASSASSSPTSGSANVGAITVTKNFPYDFGIQFFALAALFVASFVVMLA